MIRPLRSTGLLAFSCLSWIAFTPAMPQDPPKPQLKAEGPAMPQGPVEGVAKADRAFREADEIKPLPPVAIPDDPPPHEGAFFDLPLTIEPPDIIVVELLEALPGRPITGERLIRPDGTISLGFYGDVHVRGLTLKQAKEKIVLHLRRYLIDEVLGLVQQVGGTVEVDVMPGEGNVPAPNGGRNPFDLTPEPSKKPDPVPDEAPPAGTKPGPEARPAERPEGRPSARLSRRRPVPRRTRHLVRPTIGQDPPRAERPTEPQGERPEVPVAKPGQEVIVGAEMGLMQLEMIAPVDSQRFFVDIVSHNTKVYYVQGDVATPGRLPVTGRDTVLDALNYAGGFAHTAEPTDIHLYRPARGGKPAKDYKIDEQAIRRGFATANLQLFPGDRLVVGRNPIVAKTIEVDRVVGLFNSITNTIMQYGFSARTLGVMNSPPAGNANAVNVKINGQNMATDIADPAVMTPAQREALFKGWAEFFWSISNKEGGAMLDEQAFKEALMKKLTPSPKPR